MSTIQEIELQRYHKELVKDATKENIDYPTSVAVC